MNHARAEAAYQQAAAAFKNPTLDLLHGRFAPFVVATLSVIFTAERPAVAVADAHVEVEAIVEELRAAGYDQEQRQLPAGGGREICRYWVRVGWLVPQIEDGTENYRLSAQAVGALEIAGRAGGATARVSRSRMRTLLDSVDSLIQDAETDPERRMENLLTQRRALDAEIQRLQEGEVEIPEDDHLLEEAENVLHLARELPADFARVAESLHAMQRDVVTDLRRDERPAAEVLREYLHRGQHVMESTPEGRAFSGALKLIGDPAHIEQLTEQLSTLLSQPFARLLPAEQQRDIYGIATRVEQGVADVLTAQRRASHVITAQVRTHDPVRDREVDDLLRSVMSGLQTWMQTSGPADRIEALRSLPTAHIGHLRQSLSDPRPPNRPAPLNEAETDVEFVDADTREWGGPHYDQLETAVTNLHAADIEKFNLAEVFEAAPESARRPVDLLGLLEIAHRNGMTEGENVSVVHTRRPDGSLRSFAFAEVTARTERNETDE